MIYNSVDGNIDLYERDEESILQYSEQNIQDMLTNVLEIVNERSAHNISEEDFEIEMLKGEDMYLAKLGKWSFYGNDKETNIADEQWNHLPSHPLVAAGLIIAHFDQLEESARLAA